MAPSMNADIVDRKWGEMAETGTLAASAPVTSPVTSPVTRAHGFDQRVRRRRIDRKSDSFHQFIETAHSRKRTDEMMNS